MSDPRYAQVCRFSADPGTPPEWVQLAFDARPLEGGPGVFRVATVRLKVDDFRRIVNELVQHLGLLDRRPPAPDLPTP